MAFTNVKPRIFLGKFDPKIHQEKIAKSKETPKESPVKQVEMCGKYPKDSVIENAKIKYNEDQPKKFHFIRKILTDKDRNIMNEVPTMMSQTNVPMYLANPFDCEVNQMKLYHDPWTNQVLRCVIEDLYCIQTADENSLELNVDIVSIDTGQQYKHVSYNLIYNFPQRINYLLDTDHEALPAKLNLPKGLDEEDEIHDRFVTFLRSSVDSIWSIKICGYDDDHFYRVDLVTKKQDTFLERFSKVSDLLQASENASKRDRKTSHQLQQVIRLIPTSTRRSLKSNQKATFEPTGKRYNDAIDFFTNQIDNQSLKRDEVYNRRRMLKVAILDWYGPDQLTIVPLDEDYSHSHKKFLNSLASLKSMENLDSDEDIRLYEPGQFVIFKNVFEDNELGPWLRGVIVSMSCYNEHRLVIGQKSTLEERKKNFQTIQRLVKDRKVLADDLIYRVRSIDYGCDCRASPINIRRVKREYMRDFKRIGTWSLTCRLFGVHLFQGEDRFSKDTFQALDSWLRGRIASNGHENAFYVIFRDDLHEYNSRRDFDRTYNISLFHRRETSNGLCVNLNFSRPNHSKFECINWHLVERGHATQYFKNGNSNLQLEDHVMKVLNMNGKL